MTSRVEGSAGPLVARIQPLRDTLITVGVSRPQPLKDRPGLTASIDYRNRKYVNYRDHSHIPGVVCRASRVTQRS
jgi:hypothetical protein